MKKILVAFASKHQATAEIAYNITDTLRRKGLDAKCVEVGSDIDVSEYEAVILGSAVYAGQWLTKAEKFLKKNVDVLARMPVWLFSSGPTGSGDPVELLDGWIFPENLAAFAQQIHPQEIAVFGGRIDLDLLNIGERIIIKAVRGKVGDFRDWDQIYVWGTHVAEKILAIQPQEV